MLSLESHHSCHYDYVEVRDGDSINSRVIGRFCGNSRPAPLQSSGSSLHVLFVSDGYKNFDGLFATFQEISGNTNDITNNIYNIHSYLLLAVSTFIPQPTFITTVVPKRVISHTKWTKRLSRIMGNHKCVNEFSKALCAWRGIKSL